MKVIIELEFPTVVTPHGRMDIERAIKLMIEDIAYLAINSHIRVEMKFKEFLENK